MSALLLVAEWCHAMAIVLKTTRVIEETAPKVMPPDPAFGTNTWRSRLMLALGMPAACRRHHPARGAEDRNVRLVACDHPGA